MRKEEQEKLRKIRHFVLDMDGTIYLGKDVFPYTLPFLDCLKKTNRKFSFFTNNSSKDYQEYIHKLHKMDIQITKDQIMISTDVIVRYLLQYHTGQSVYLVGTPALTRAFQSAGIKIDEQDPDIVVLGFDTTLTYEKLAKACTLIRHGKAYYGINPDLNCPIEHNEFIPDCGSIAKLIEASTGRYPEFFGKPSKKTLDYIVEKTGLREDEIAIVGDRLYTDIQVAQDSEVTSILVFSGETTRQDIQKSIIRPDIVVENIGCLIPYLTKK